MKATLRQNGTLAWPLPRTPWETLCTFAVRLVELPHPPVLVLRAPPGVAIYADLRRTRAHHFDRAEWIALAYAAEAHRADERTMRAWVERKQRGAPWRLTLLEALGETRDFEPTWTVHQVLLQLGCELTTVFREIPCGP